MTWLTTILLSNAVVVILLALPAWLAGRVFQRPAVAHALWTLVLLKLVTPPILALPIPAPLAQDSQPEWWRPFDSPGASAGRVREETVSARELVAPFSAAADAHQGLRGESAQTPKRERSQTEAISRIRRTPPAERHWSETILSNLRPWHGIIALWIAGGAIWLCLQIAAMRRLRRLVRESPPAPAKLAELADRCAREMGLPRAPLIRIMDNSASPMLYGFGKRACIVLPAELLRRLSPEAQTTILVHELAHFCRGDQFVRIIELLATTIFWWHPVAWWALRELEIAEEQCCDATVLRYCTGKARVYAEAILDIVDLMSERGERIRPVLASGLRQRPALRRRLRDVMSGRPIPLLTQSGRFVLLVSGLACLICRPEMVFSKTTAPAPGAFTVDSLGSDSPPSSARTAGDSIAEPPGKSRPLSLLPPRRESTEWARAMASGGRSLILVRDGYQCELVDADGALVRDLSPYRITCVAFSPDGARFMTGELRGAVRLWEASTGRELGLLAQCAADVLSIDCSVDGDRIVVSDRAGVVEMLSLARPRERVQFARWPGAIRCVRFSPAGERLAAAADTWHTSAAGRIAIYDVATGALQHDWRLAAPVGALRFESESRLLAADWSGRVTPWSLNDGQSGEPCVVPKERVSAESFSAQAAGLSESAPK